MALVGTRHQWKGAPMTEERRTATRALVLGESLIDIILDGETRTEVPGGSPMNLSIGLARQGIDVAFITSLGADRHADTIERRLVHEGVDVYTPRRAGRTCTATAMLDDRGTPSYDFDLTWMLDNTDTPAGVPDVVHFGSLGSALQPGADQVDELVAQYRGDALVTYDPNIRPRIDPDRDAARTRVDRHAALSDIVKASDEDLAYLHPELVADPADIADDVREAMIESTIARWLAAGTSLVVITRAEHGIDMATAQCKLHIPGHHPRVVDRIGGGDAFMAGLIAGLDVVGLFGATGRATLSTLAPHTLRRAGSWAQRTAEITVGRVGADPPTSVELLPRSEAQSYGDRAPAADH
ncbi:MAG: carbohydrate kinase [Leifsonia sp.]|nr:carbohydrate kinase [Leifsonia sp.]